MTTIGEVNEVTKEEELNFEWRIKDFFSLSKEVGKYYKSSDFTFAGDSWHLEIYPNGLRSKNTVGYVGVFIYRSTHVPPINVAYSLGLKTFDGNKDKTVQGTYKFDELLWYGSHRLVAKVELSQNKSELVPSDVLTIVCTLEYTKSTENSGNISTANCTYCKKSFSEYASSHEEKCLKKPIRCQTCNDVVELSKWFHHECQMARVKATEKLVGDLANSLDSGEHSDVTIKVKGVEFKLHRSILGCRNPYFHSMFTTEMTEKTTGVVNIDDCEPDIFEAFIHFVYTGKIESLSSDNVCAMYKIADKYQEDQLKEECLNFMKSKISVDNFCNFITLSLKHDEKELLETATLFYCKQTKEIMLSVEWQTFIREYPTQSNELNIKAFDYNASKCA